MLVGTGDGSDGGDRADLAPRGPGILSRTGGVREAFPRSGPRPDAPLPSAITAMLLLTGATGLVGSSLLSRLVAAGEPVRCLVRDPRRLGPMRVRVQIALGDLADPPSFRNALRGVDTVVHLGATRRDQ